jgi:hypothetical protein
MSAILLEPPLVPQVDRPMRRQGRPERAKNATITSPV